MPIEATLLRDAPIEAESCPRCKAKPLELMMRGLVHRRKWGFSFEWPLLVRFRGHRPYCAVICLDCKEIIAWEEPTLDDYWRHEESKIHAVAKTKIMSGMDSTSASCMSTNSAAMGFDAYDHERQQTIKEARKKT